MISNFTLFPMYQNHIFDSLILFTIYKNILVFKFRFKETRYGNNI